MPLDVAVDPRQSYPILRSGHVAFQNSEPPYSKVDIDCCDYAILRSHGARHIIMDSGAVGTVIPGGLAKVLGIKEPAPEEDRWQLASGIGGTSVGYYPNAPISLTLIGGNGESRTASVYPLVYVCCAPSFSATQEHRTAFKGRSLWPKAITEAVKVPFDMHEGGYEASVHSPSGTCSILGKRPALQAMSGQEGLDVVLIGRDWQGEHELLFRRDTLRII